MITTGGKAPALPKASGFGPWPRMSHSRFPPTRTHAHPPELAPVPFVAVPPDGSRITCITPTGDRPLAFALCQRWMMRQTMQADQWIVVDDGRNPAEPSVPMEYVRREPRGDDPKCTLAVNLREALPRITGNKILVIEDDEYYAPGYIAEMSRRLDVYELVGICRSKYYHVPTGGYMTNGNGGHASLAETGFRASFLPVVSSCIGKGIDIHWLDTQLWRIANSSGSRNFHLFVDLDEPLYVGIKGLPGREGVGIGHQTRAYRTRDGVNREILKRWIPRDYQVYLDYLGGQLNENTAGLISGEVAA